MGAVAAGDSFLTRSGGVSESGGGAGVDEGADVMVLSRLATGELGSEGGRW